MSIVTTQPEMVLAAAVHDYPLGGAGTDGSRWIERRQSGSPGDAPVDILMRLPAVVVLERIPVPCLAMARDGIIFFANTAFAEMVGYGQDRLAGAAFPEFFHTVPAALCALSGVDALANLVVELEHCEGWTVRARMSKSALMRSDDPVVLVTFENLTERLWMDER
jgi:PAS domain S-box-containing protein